MLKSQNQNNCKNSFLSFTLFVLFDKHKINEKFHFGFSRLLQDFTKCFKDCAEEYHMFFCHNSHKSAFLLLEPIILLFNFKRKLYRYHTFNFLRKKFGVQLYDKKVKDINLILYYLVLLQRCKVYLGALFLSFLLNVLCFDHKMFLF